MRIAGLELSDRLVLELSLMLRNGGYECTAIRLDRAFDKVAFEVELTLQEREHIMHVLDASPNGLAQLRATLLQERRPHAQGLP